MPLIVQIRRQQFDINREYKAGDVLTEGEALALNQLFVEKIRKKVVSQVARAVRMYGVLSTEQHNELQDYINSCVRSYEFSPKPGYRPEVPIENAIREVAHQRADRWGQQNGFTPDSIEVRSRYTELLNDPAIVDAARELLRSRLTVTGSLLKDLA